ncbi:MAG: DUF417 family protein [Nocardioidaceae bacterium]
MSSLRSAIAPFGRHFVRCALALILIWVGGLKFAAYEAEAVQALTSESPLLSWVYDIVSVPAFARILGVVEILAGIGIALRPIVPLLSALGSAFAVLLFATTLTFLFTTPGVYTSGGFPQLSPMPGQFLAKDLMLLAVAIWPLGDALSDMRSARGAHEEVSQ